MGGLKNMKRLFALMLAMIMVLSLAACGGSDAPAESSAAANSNTESSAAADNNAGSADAPAEEFKLEKVKMVVNGTLTATVDNGQADFEKQWEDAVGIDLEISQLDHSGYVDAVGRLFASQEYPDVMIMSADMYAQYAPTGLLWDMTEAYENADFQSRMTLFLQSTKLLRRMESFTASLLPMVMVV